jgi:nucleoside-diphosphate-sugar epimerase
MLVVRPDVAELVGEDANTLRLLNIRSHPDNPARVVRPPVRGVRHGVALQLVPGRADQLAERVPEASRASADQLHHRRRRPATERDPNPAVGPDSPRGGAENLALTYADRGVRVISARFAPTVHGAGDHGFISIIAQAARRRGAPVYPGEGRNRWSAVHRSDAARLVRLGLENAPAGTILHAAAEEGVPVRRIAEALATRLGVPVKSAPPEQIADEIPFVGRFLAADLSATSTITRDLFGWQPTGPTFLEDIAEGHYDQL